MGASARATYRTYVYIVCLLSDYYGYGILKVWIEVVVDCSGEILGNDIWCNQKRLICPPCGEGWTRPRESILRIVIVLMTNIIFRNKKPAHRGQEGLAEQRHMCRVLLEAYYPNRIKKDNYLFCFIILLTSVGVTLLFGIIFAIVFEVFL